MSGHSKWSKIKRTKLVSDKKRSQLFAKLGKAITVAAREKGGDLSMNFKLKLAVEQARSANMPKETIERAIARGTGSKSEEAFAELLYEGFGPGGAALIIKVLTDNKNRTSSEIRHLLGSYGGRLGDIGSVKWQFAKKGVMRVFAEEKDDFELVLIDAGAEDTKRSGEVYIIYTKPEELQRVKEILEAQGVKIHDAEIEYVPLKTIKIEEPEEKNRLHKLLDALDEHDDVSEIYTNH